MLHTGNKTIIIFLNFTKVLVTNVQIKGLLNILSGFGMNNQDQMVF